MISLALISALSAGVFAASHKNAPLSAVPLLPTAATAAAARAFEPFAATPAPKTLAGVPEAAAALLAASPTHASPEARALQAGQLFDGGAAGRPEAVAAAAAVLPPYLASAHPGHAAWLGKIVAAAKRSKTGRRVLRDARALSARQGRPIVVAVGEPRGWAAFDFDTQLLWMTKASLRKGVKNGAAALIHELRHAVQLGLGLPDIFELELDAYMFDFRVAVELGDKAAPGTFDAQARAAFRKGPEEFVRYLRRYYKADLARLGRAAEYRAELLGSLESSVAARDRALGVLSRRREVLESMKAARYPSEAVEAFVLDSVAPVERRVAETSRMVKSLKRDLGLHDDPVSRRRAASFARRAVERLERLSGALDVR